LVFQDLLVLIQKLVDARVRRCRFDITLRLGDEKTPCDQTGRRVKMATYLAFIPTFLRLLYRLLQQFQQLAFPYKVAGNFVAVKQDDRDVVAIAVEKFWIF